MAKFLDTFGISNEIAQLIKGAKDKLYLISPYLQIDDRFKEMIADKDRMKLDVRIIYRENKLQPQENNWLKSLTFVRTSLCKNLHAKCYLNESKAIVTSMNLYKFSQENNKEMGILVLKSEDEELYNAIYEEALILYRGSEEIKVTVEKIIPKEELIKNSEGHCIRCGINIKLDPEHPYCLTDYQSWKKFEDEAYIEKTGFCHVCGKSNDSSMGKPVCINCYRKNKKLLKKN